jgi:hypothetical protein
LDKENTMDVMALIARRQRFDFWILSLRWRLEYKLRRWARAWHYARGTLSKDAASQVRWDCQDAAEDYTLISLSVADVYDNALERWEDHPDLRGLCAEAAGRVASKFDDYTEVRSSCTDWALELVGDYAESCGITLAEIEED